jgi:hypothetical protein
VTKAPLLAAVLFIAPLLAWGGTGYPGDETAPCGDCHPRQQAGFQRSRMAMAARTPAFLEEWRQKGRPDTCFACHAPTRGAGVACTDCHGSAGHPYPGLSLPAVCAPCHDAPGELTLRSFRDSPAARRGEDCLSCHLPGEGFSHDFRGPRRRGFLQGIATLAIAFRREPAGDTALLRIRHRAGHALPGGTTGRAVWLLVEQRDVGGRVVAERHYRFGWLHSPTAGWRENSLPPGVGKVVEVPLHEAAGVIRAKLIYRLRAGGLEIADPDQVVLVDETRPLAFRAVP